MKMHTPGPWLVAQHPNSKRSIFDKRGAFVAKVDVGFAVPDPMLEANARLIAAAPELLEQLIAAVTRLKAKDNGTNHMDPKLIQSIESVIARATGKGEVK